MRSFLRGIGTAASVVLCFAVSSSYVARAQPAGAPLTSAGSRAPLLQPADPWLLREQQLEARLTLLGGETERLERAGRPEHFALRRTGGFVMLGLGGTLVLGSWLTLFVAGGAIGPHSSSSELSRAGEIAFGTALALGLISAAVGGVSLATANHGNLNRDRVRELSLEQQVVRRQIKQARRERKLRRRYAASPQLSLRCGFYVGLSIALTL